MRKLIAVAAATTALLVAAPAVAHDVPGWVVDYPHTTNQVIDTPLVSPIYVEESGTWDWDWSGYAVHAACKFKAKLQVKVESAVDPIFYARAEFSYVKIRAANQNGFVKADDDAIVTVDSNDGWTTLAAIQLAVHPNGGVRWWFPKANTQVSDTFTNLADQTVITTYRIRYTDAANDGCGKS